MSMVDCFLNIRDVHSISYPEHQGYSWDIVSWTSGIFIVYHVLKIRDVQGNLCHGHQG